MHAASFMPSFRGFLLLGGAVVVTSSTLPLPIARADTAPDEATPPPIEAPTPARAMTLQEALEYAHVHQPAIHAALSRVSVRMAQAKVPSGKWLPTVAISAQLFALTANNTTATFVQPAYMDLPRIGGTPVQSDTNSSLAPYPSTLAGVGLTQEVFDFGRISAQRAAADALSESTKHSADAERLDIDFDVEEAYFSVFAARSIITAADQAYERSLVHRNLAKKGVDAGLRSPIELTRAEADLARFDVGRIKARGSLAVAQSVLSAAIGSPDLAIDATGTPPQPGEMPSLGRALQQARERDPQLAAALSDLKAAEEHTHAVGAELRPDLSLSATLSGRAGGVSGTPIPTGAGWIPDVPNWDVGLVLSWPLFDGVIAARKDAARSEEQLRRDEIDVRREQEVAQVNQAYVSVQVARSALVALQNSVIAARANYDQANARFTAGIGNAVELADAEAVRTNAEIQLALGQFELARARSAFGRAIAEGL
jgi:outer membrane protein